MGLSVTQYNSTAPHTKASKMNEAVLERCWLNLSVKSKSGVALCSAYYILVLYNYLFWTETIWKSLKQKEKTYLVKSIKYKFGVIVYHCASLRLRAAVIFRGEFCIPSYWLTNSLADSGGWIHLVAVVAFTLVSPLQVDADLAADARVQTLIDICREREMRMRKPENSWYLTCLINQICTSASSV